MPVYEFNCKSNNCGRYEVWRAIDERNTSTECPSCGGEGQRIFNPPMALTGSLRLKVESREPTLVSTREEREESLKPQLKESGTRPWMLTRGC